MAQRHLFSVYDLCQKLVEAVANSPQSIPTLVALATVCKSISEVALDKLWDEVGDFQQVAGLLPPDAYIDGIDEYRDLTEDDLKTFDKYAGRIKTLTVGEDHDSRLLQQFVSLRRPLLPNLRELIWSIDLTTSNIIAVMAPSLEYLMVMDRENESFPSIDPSPSFRLIMRHMVSSLPNLKTLQCEAPMNAAPLTRAIFYKTVGNLTSVETLSLFNEIDNEALLAVSMLPRLKSVRLILDRDNAVALRHVRGKATFPSLEDMEVVSDGAPVLETVLSTITSSSFTSLRIMLSGDSPDMCAVGVAVSARSGTLNTFVANLPGRASNGPLASMADFRPLTLFCRSMRHFEFNCPHATFNITDEDILTIAESWPHIEVLKLHDAYGSTTSRRPTLTLKALRTLSDKCIHLKKLQCAIDGSQVSVTDIPPTSHKSSSPLLSLDLCESIFVQGDITATLLKSMFPHLKSFCGEPWYPRQDGDEDEEDEEHEANSFPNCEDEWKRVRGALPGIDYDFY